MIWNNYSDTAQEGDLIELVGLSFKHFIVKLRKNERFQSHRGIIEHNDLIGKAWGSLVLTHTGKPFYLMQPSLVNLLLYTPRNTQIMYPKDIGFILLNMGIGPGTRVLEAGTGSGGLTTAFAYAVGDTGKVISYERRSQNQNLAAKNIRRIGLDERVEFKLGDIEDGFDEKNVDALFLDVPNPYDYMEHVKETLKPGGHFGSILPTTNQVSLLLAGLKKNKFAFIEVCEIIQRYYKPEPERLRPSDRMVAHTGYLIFARSVLEEYKGVHKEDKKMRYREIEQEEES